MTATTTVVAEGIEIAVGRHYTAHATVRRSDLPHGAYFVAIVSLRGPGVCTLAAMTAGGATADTAIAAVRFTATATVRALEGAYAAGEMAS